MAPETPTAKAVRLLGEKELAYACGLTTAAIGKWGALIPSRHQAKVYSLARSKGVRLTAEQIIGVAA